MTRPINPASLASAVQDQRFMSGALALARRGLGNTWPNPAVGAILVRNDGAETRIVGRGWTQLGGRPHAETEALRRAGAAARGATLYVTLEPCAHHGRTGPCADAVIAAGVKRVVSAMEDPDPRVAGQGHARLRAAGVHVDIGQNADEARRIVAGHISRVTLGRPHVTLKLAISRDGKVALAGRRPVAITGAAANRRVHLLRAQHDAIAIGIGTARADDPLLTCRLPGLGERSPARVVLDSALQLATDSRLAKGVSEAPVWIVAADDAPSERAAVLSGRGLDILRVPRGATGLDLHAALGALAARGITRLLVEGGPTLATVLLRADLLDEVVLLQSANDLGTDAIDALNGVPLDVITASQHFAAQDVEHYGADTMRTYLRR